MTANRNLKQRVRARALKTGESYTAARRQLAGSPRSMTVAAAQLPLLPDPGDGGQIKASGEAVRTLMRQASTRGAGLAHFPAGALTCPGKRVMSSTGPDGIGPADWDRADWAGLAREVDEVARLLSSAKSALMYTGPGAARWSSPPPASASAALDVPGIFPIEAAGHAAANSLAVADVTTSTDSPARRWRRTARELRN
ncbi:MAG TPA: hypothetical protein VFV73_01705 [Streptosporangiaceae bacterium]|nr:hypothetical protein [Streptosporangiaceae bacterium]